MEVSGGVSLNPQTAQHTGFVNLVRGNRWRTFLGWGPLLMPSDPVAQKEIKPELTADSSAVIASVHCGLDNNDDGSPATIRAGKKLNVTLDCQLMTKRYWTLLAATPELHANFVVSGPTHLPPGYAGTPELTLVAKKDVRTSDIPLAAVYLMLLS